MPVTAASRSPLTRPQRADLPKVRVGIAAWCGVVATGTVVAFVLEAMGHDISIDAPPLHARFEPTVVATVLLPIAIAALVVRYGVRLVTRQSWTRVVAGSWVAAAAWSVALALARGPERLVGPVRKPNEYLAAVPMVHDLGGFLATFAERISTYPTHVQGHPPGTVLVLGALRELGLGGAVPAATLFVVAGAAAVPAVLVAARDVAGEEVARRAAPFLVLAPAAIWVATSADALYSGVAAWGAALLVLATGRRDRHGDAAAAAGGVLLGAAAFGSYGMVLLSLVPLAVGWHRRRVRPFIVGALAALAVVAAFALAGFWWLDGLIATRDRYRAGIASRRAYIPFLFVNLAALAVSLGPAIVVGLTRLRDRRVWILVGAALCAVSLAALSGMSKGEVERIWIPFTPWLLLAGVALMPSVARTAPRVVRSVPVAGWLALQGAAAIALESLVRTPW
jgi:hypothetical protein